MTHVNLIRELYEISYKYVWENVPFTTPTHTRVAPHIGTHPHLMGCCTAIKPHMFVGNFYHFFLKKNKCWTHRHCCVRVVQIIYLNFKCMLEERKKKKKKSGPTWHLRY
jgi:hypothetical protein